MALDWAKDILGKLVDILTEVKALNTKIESVGAAAQREGETAREYAEMLERRVATLEATNGELRERLAALETKFGIATRTPAIEATVQASEKNRLLSDSHATGNAPDQIASDGDGG